MDGAASRLPGWCVLVRSRWMKEGGSGVLMARRCAVASCNRRSGVCVCMWALLCPLRVCAGRVPRGALGGVRGRVLPFLPAHPCVLRGVCGCLLFSFVSFLPTAEAVRHTGKKDSLSPTRWRCAQMSAVGGAVSGEGPRRPCRSQGLARLLLLAALPALPRSPSKPAGAYARHGMRGPAPLHLSLPSACSLSVRVRMCVCASGDGNQMEASRCTVVGEATGCRVPHAGLSV